MSAISRSTRSGHRPQRIYHICALFLIQIRPTVTVAGGGMDTQSRALYWACRATVQGDRNWDNHFTSEISLLYSPAIGYRSNIWTTLGPGQLVEGFKDKLDSCPNLKHVPYFVNGHKICCKAMFAFHHKRGRLVLCSLSNDIYTHPCNSWLWHEFRLKRSSYSRH